MRGFVIGLVLLFAVFTFVGAMGQTPPSVSSKTEASR